MNDHVLKINFKKKILSYILGFFFSVILTVIPFVLVVYQLFDKRIIFIILMLSAFIQIIIQLKYFLHLNFSNTDYWNIFFLLFTVLIVCIIMFGSIWIMYNLNHHFIYYIDY